MIQTFKQCMRCLLEERQISRTDWPKLTQEITFVCNSLVNVSTGFTPHEIMFGERLRGGIDTVLPPGEHATYSDLTSYVEDAKSRDVEIQGKVAENIENAQERMKSVYDRKAKTSEIRPGDWVLLKDQV